MFILKNFKSTGLEKLNVVGKYAAFRNSFSYLIKSNIPGDQTLIEVLFFLLISFIKTLFLNVTFLFQRFKTK